VIFNSAPKGTNYSTSGVWLGPEEILFKDVMPPAEMSILHVYGFFGTWIRPLAPEYFIMSIYFYFLSLSAEFRGLFVPRYELRGHGHRLTALIYIPAAIVRTWVTNYLLVHTTLGTWKLVDSFR
jgi:hypothetical protein